jgi:hypothetical protein
LRFRFLLLDELVVIQCALFATGPQLSGGGRCEQACQNGQKTEDSDADVLIQTHDLKPLKASLASIKKCRHQVHSLWFGFSGRANRANLARFAGCVAFAGAMIASLVVA